MQLTGIALDCNRTDTSWGKSDGTAGIRGIVISNADAARAAGYIASFISGLGQGMVKETTEYVGNSTRETTGGTWKDILGKAFSNSAEKIATDMLQQAAKEVSYVEAEAGTEFYIYVQQVVDPTQAARGKMSAGNKLTRGEEKETSRSNLVIPQKRN